jgi:hypothetical protein
MTPQNADTHEVVSLDDLKPFVTANGPCLTAVVALDNPAEIPARFKNALRALRASLQPVADPATIADLMAPVSEVAAMAHAAHLWAHSLILFRAPAVFRYFLLHGRVPEMQEAGGRFQVRPLLATLTHFTRFHLLALSRKHVRLFHCTHHHAEASAAALPPSLEAWKNNRQPDHVMANRSSAGPSMGGMAAVVSSSNADSDREDQYLAHFFKEIDRGIVAALRGRSEPLVLAGVEHDVSLYRRVNRYRPTFDEAVRGAADSVGDRVLHSRAMDVVTRSFTEPVRTAIAEIRDAGSGRAPSDLQQVLRAAFQGRVKDLLIGANARYEGEWDENRQAAETNGRGGEDLLNAAALATLRHGGRAFVLDDADMPGNAPAAAFLRY